MLQRLQNLSRQEKFDLIMVIVSITLFLCMLAWLSVQMLERRDHRCKYVSDYKNTLQHDIHRRIVCGDE